MNTDRGRPLTSRAARRVDVLFGGIFLAIGLGALLAAAILFLVLGDEPGMGNRIWAFLLSPLTIGIIFSSLGAIYLRRGLRKMRKEARLLQTGTTTEAVITAIEPTNTRLNRRTLWRVRYAFDDLSGVARQGDSGYLSAEEAQSYRLGEPVFIRYDAEQPAESIWLGREDQLPAS